MPIKLMKILCRFLTFIVLGVIGFLSLMDSEQRQEVWIYNDKGFLTIKILTDLLNKEISQDLFFTKETVYSISSYFEAKLSRSMA